MSVSINGTGGITFADASTQSTGGYTGFRNRIINGAMMIDQRNAGASVSPSGSSVFCTDRWRIQAPAGTAQRISSTLSAFAYSLKYTASDSNAYMQMGQQIEFLNCSDMQNQTVTISFRAKANNSNSGSTALTVRTRTGATVDGSVIFAGTNADTSVTITTSDAAYSVTRTLPATFGALSVEFVLGSHVSGDGLEITGIQLEKGSVATPFEFRPYGMELSLCQRYYWQQLYTDTYENILDPARAESPNAARGTFYYPVTMRAAPSVGNNGVGNFRVNDSRGNDQTCNSITIGQVTPSKAVLIFGKATANLTVADCVYINTELANDAALYFNAEL